MNDFTPEHLASKGHRAAVRSTVGMVVLVVPVGTMAVAGAFNSSSPSSAPAATTVCPSDQQTCNGVYTVFVQWHSEAAANTEPWQQQAADLVDDVGSNICSGMGFRRAQTVALSFLTPIGGRARVSGRLVPSPP